MDRTAAQRAIRSLVSSLIGINQFGELLAALERARPDIARRHLEVCRGDRIAAGTALAMQNDSSNGATVLETYLYGDARSTLKALEILIETANRIHAQRQALDS